MMIMNDDDDGGCSESRRPGAASHTTRVAGGPTRDRIPAPLPTSGGHDELDINNISLRGLGVSKKFKKVLK